MQAVAGYIWVVASWIGSTLSDTLFAQPNFDAGARDSLQQLMDNLVRFLTAIGQFHMDASPAASRASSREVWGVAPLLPGLRVAGQWFALCTGQAT